MIKYIFIRKLSIKQSWCPGKRMGGYPSATHDNPATSTWRYSKKTKIRMDFVLVSPATCTEFPCHLSAKRVVFELGSRRLFRRDWPMSFSCLPPSKMVPPRQRFLRGAREKNLPYPPKKIPCTFIL